ncbi:PAS domain-containing hybrid sensor histidine kinase/response regulator [Ancylobacter lacus]|uniref:PAS domain-containing hybrid sensor histidine kinase/response regulator n=1 Tax=Ancylobacter lacus TaxID=2579970 RepID=UPI001BCB917E|nr:PAS domain S-box protein [Ancylobacter lacus]MBS7539161.1 PAS domain S-box protein [Ancylobacter lacus]
MPLFDDDLARMLIDELDGGVIVVDRERRVLIWNRWMAAATGKPASACLGRPLDDLFADTPARLWAALREAFSAGTASLLTHSLHAAVFPLRTRAGLELVHNASVRPLGPKPHDTCLIQLVDVTASANRERVLRQRQNARYHAVVDSALDAILTLDADGVIQLANPSAAGLFDRPAEDLVGVTLSSLLQEHGAWRTAWERVLGGDPLTRPVEVEARRRDGSASFLELTASRWTSDARYFVTAILRDVNERKAAEAELRGLNMTLERRVAERTAERDRMWRLSTDIMVVARLDGVIKATNPAWTHLLGWEAGQSGGAPLVDFVAPEDRERFRGILDALGRETLPQRFALPLRTREGGLRWIEWSAVAADDLLQAVGRDITAQREAESTLRRTEAALRQAQKMEAVGQLTGGIAHDFNNMMTGVIGAIDIMKRRIAAGRLDDLDHFMTAASSSAQRATALTQRLLAFSRRQSLDSRPVDINALVGSLEDLLRRTIGESVRLDTRLDPALCWATADANQLESAILNLAINARDAMPGGGQLTVTTRQQSFTALDVLATHELKPGRYIVIAVADTGSGMAPEVLNKVFEPFFTTKPVGQGTGLGLSMVYGFARQSNGHVEIRSVPGQGTTVELYLPVAEAPAPPRPEPPAVAFEGEGQTVLLVEDDESVRLLVADILQELGYASVVTAEAQSALRELSANRDIQLMISDVGLPGMNGRQLAELARRERPDLAILFLTGYAEDAVMRSEFLGPGMAMMTKPFAIEALATKIREMIAAPARRAVCP